MVEPHREGSERPAERDMQGAGFAQWLGTESASAPGGGYPGAMQAEACAASGIPACANAQRCGLGEASTPADGYPGAMCQAQLAPHAGRGMMRATGSDFALSTAPVPPAFFVRARAVGLTPFEPFGGICSGLKAALRAGLPIRRYIYCDTCNAVATQT
jgi:hypothetical protein